MLELTAAAEECLLQLRNQRGSNERSGARFVAHSGSLHVVFAAGPEPDDCVVSGADLPIFVAPEASAILDRGVLDVASGDQGAALVLRRRARTSESVVIGLGRPPRAAPDPVQEPASMGFEAAGVLPPSAAGPG